LDPLIKSRGPVMSRPSSFFEYVSVARVIRLDVRSAIECDIDALSRHERTRSHRDFRRVQRKTTQETGSSSLPGVESFRRLARIHDLRGCRHRSRDGVQRDRGRFTGGLCGRLVRGNMFGGAPFLLRARAMTL
jgi:hypothetical protein